jgi:hypothetical protein
VTITSLAPKSGWGGHPQWGDDYRAPSRITHLTSGERLTVKKTPSGLARQQVDGVAAIRRLHRMRGEARDEISRLIDFLDASDPYVMTELDDSDEREDGGDSEPSQFRSNDEPA